MKDRIRQIMESQHMSQQVFAQFIEMSPASLSSIFNGRTKPTINVVEAIKKKIPDLSVDWLIFGSGPMYISSASQQPPAPKPATSPVSEEPVLNFSDSPAPTPSSVSSGVTENCNPSSLFFNSVKNTHQSVGREDMKIVDKIPRRVTEIRVFYDDQTWESFVPAKK
jgi:transcriptional regulator with XRE-family HTH domain